MNNKTYFDDSYPVIITPRLLESNDEWISNLFRREFCRHQPDLYEWKWIEGESMEIRQGEEDDFFDPLNFWLNKEYRIGTGRLRESIESSNAVNWCDLGNGYRLHYAGFDYQKKERDWRDVLLLDFLYLSNRWSGAKTNDGTARLRKWINYVAEMPDNPYNWMILHPVGEETLDYGSPHLAACNYAKTGHTTSDLLKLYKYWLKIKRTDIPSNGGMKDQFYYCVDCYKPRHPKFKAERSKFPELFDESSK